jgi:transposase
MSITIDTGSLFDEGATTEPNNLDGRTVINRSLYYVDRAGVRVVFQWHEPLYRFSISDTLSMRFVAVHLRLGELATQEEVSRSFGHSVATQRRWEKRFQEQGLQGLEDKKSSGRPRSVPETCDFLLRKWFEQGITNAEMARRLQVSDTAIHRALARLGLRRRPPASAELPWSDDDSGTRSAEQLAGEDLEQDEKKDEETKDGEGTIEALSSRTNHRTGDDVRWESSSHQEGLRAGASGKVVKSVKPVDGSGEHEVAVATRPGSSEGQRVETGELEIAVDSESDDEPGVGRQECLSDALAELAGEGFTIDRDPDDRVGDRVLARLGQLADAVPLFGDRPCLRQAGVLLAVPLLVKSGLLETFSQTYHSLGPAFYGLRTTVVVLFLAALLRIKRPEHFKEHNPRELGHVVGLDRAPEVKTVRRKVTELASRGRARELMQARAQHRIDEAPDRVAFLYVDGHVREYHGGHALAKAKKSQSQVAKPAATDNWVHDAHGEPLLVVTSEMNESLTQVLEPILQDVKELVGDHRPTVIFDRGGYSPKLFARLVDLGFDVMTYRKGKTSPWPKSHFVEEEFVIDGRTYRYQVAERKRVKVGRLRPKRKRRSRRLGPEFFWMREVRTLRADGRQTAILTTRRDLVSVEVPYRQFNRWRQENYFKYMAAEFELDGLLEYQVQDVAEGTDRPNPARRPIERKLSKARADVQRLQAQLGDAVGRPGPSGQRTVHGFKIAHAKLRAKLAVAEQEVSRLAAQLQAIPKRVPADGVKTLTTEKKLIADVIKMTAYQIETELLAWLRDDYGRTDDEGRTLLQTAFQSTARIEVRKEELYVELVPQASPHRTAAIRALCEKLNTMGAKFPGTRLRLNLAIQPHEPLTNQQGVCQEF